MFAELEAQREALIPALRRTIEVLFGKRDHFEFRVIEGRPDRPGLTRTNRASMATLENDLGWVTEITNQWTAGVYVTLNPVRAREDEEEGAARDGDIVKRRWLMVD